MTALIKVPFHGAELALINQDGEPYVPMKPIVEGIGLAWQVQHRKMTEGRFKSSITEMVIQVDGDTQKRPYTCLHLRKLPGWLMSIHPNKVAPELREKIIAYQNECDDVLWSYWNDGQAVNPRAAQPKPEFPQGAFKEFQFTRVELVKTIADMTEHSLRIASLLGLQDNQGRFYADKLVKRQIGIGPMELLELPALTSAQANLAFSPQQLGARFKMSAQTFNKLLMRCGFQTKAPEGESPAWRSTPKGDPFCSYEDTGRQHNSGAPVQVLRWKESVLDEIKKSANELDGMLKSVVRG